MELHEIETCLNAEGMTTLLQPASPEQPLEQLLVLLELEDADTRLAVELLYVPDIEEEFEAVKLLQFFVTLPFEIDETKVRLACDALMRINYTLPLMAFSYQEEGHYLYFRHVLMLPKSASASDKDVIVQTVWLIFYVIETSYPTIAAALPGQPPA